MLKIEQREDKIEEGKEMKKTKSAFCDPVT